MASGRPNAETLAWQKLLIETWLCRAHHPARLWRLWRRTRHPEIAHHCRGIHPRRRTGPARQSGHLDAGADACWSSAPKLQKREFIAPTLRGEIIWCQGYSEPGAGSDLASLQTRASEDAHDFIINGQKIWTSTAQHADMIFCLVRTESDSPKHQGISYLIFSMKTPGIEVRPLAHHDRPCRIQRGLLHRCARAQGPDRGRARAGLVRRQRHAQA